MSRMQESMGWLRSLARAYTFNTPFKKGCYRIADAAISHGGELPERVLVRTTDGCEIILDPSDSGYRYTYFLGEYEPAVSRCIRNVVKAGDVCLDIGANAGWFTIMLMKLSGPRGAVHAFEPVPATYEMLLENITTNKGLGNAKANCLALGSEIGKVEMILEDGLPDGHASVEFSDEAEGARFSVKQDTLDTYLSDNNIERVDFLKMDIEGSELEMLKGSGLLFSGVTKPVMVVEMALATSKRFGYEPNDLISFINEQAPYRFFEIAENRAAVLEFNRFPEGSVGANVLCVPADAPADKFDSLGIR